MRAGLEDAVTAFIAGLRVVMLVAAALALASALVAAFMIRQDEGRAAAAPAEPPRLAVRGGES